MFFRRNTTGISILPTVLLAACALISACSDSLNTWTEGASGSKISIGGIDTDAMTVSGVSSRATGATRATGVDAETVDWLVKPLKDGIDITYGLYNTAESHEDVAILKLSDTDGDGGKDYDKENGLAVYTFRYRADHAARPEIDSENNAIWYNNGYHFFQGVHVPERIRYTSDNPEDAEAPDRAPGLLRDQHNDTATGSDADLGNYTLLSHYLGMPAGFRLAATVERIKLPFRHRLARVVAFILIDPELQTTLKGYRAKDANGDLTGDEDPTTTSFRFCNVKVLQGVKDVDENGHHTLTPTWGTARKVIPHFEGEKGSYSYKTQEDLDPSGFKYYYTTDDNGRLQQLFPTSTGWKAVHDATPDSKGLYNGYTMVDYGKVPVYDIIVRPTYTTADSVMYDEKDYTTQKAALAAEKNKIDFEIELENGLRYEKRFEFDLNANYQTVVYLRVAREHVDYNDAGAEVWQEKEKYWDGWYGVDNGNGNILSHAGSSWQRAFTYYNSANPFFSESTNNTHSAEKDGAGANGITDGNYYDTNTLRNEPVRQAQYFSETYKAEWVKRFLQACEGGAHHGDYFVLCDDITIDACLIPEGFVFTGHLDGQDHIITLENTDVTVVDKEAWEEDDDDDPDTDPVHHEAITHQSPTFLFAGLNGIYTTKQESDSAVKDWEANVHKETNSSGTHWVPTRGYRAEVINVKVASASLFKPDAYITGNVTGNVQNCWSRWTGTKASSESVPNHTPDIPKYK